MRCPKKQTRIFSGLLGQSADGEGFELHDNSSGNHADPSFRGTKTTRAHFDGSASDLDLPEAVLKLIDTCTGLNDEAMGRVLNFALYELASQRITP